MRDCVRELCVLSIFCGAALSLCPEGGGKRVLHILETVVLLAVILNGIGRMDFSPYAVELAKLHEKENELAADSQEIRNRLDRLVIEEEYRAYVEGRAKAIGVCPTEILIRTRWNKDGLWVPDSSRIQLNTASVPGELSRMLAGELGIPAERQEWILDG